MIGRQLPSAPKVSTKDRCAAWHRQARLPRTLLPPLPSKRRFFRQPDRSDDGDIYRALEGLHQAAPQPRYPAVPTVAAHVGMAWGSARRIPSCLKHLRPENSSKGSTASIESPHRRQPVLACGVPMLVSEL